VKVELHLFANLAGYLPAGSAGDSVTLEVPDGTTVAEVIRFLEIPEDLECLRVVNGRDAPSEHRLADGDVLSLFPPLAGGSCTKIDDTLQIEPDIGDIAPMESAPEPGGAAP